MKATLALVPAELLEERRRRGADHRDEMWEGVLHMAPPASERHQRLGSELLAVLLPIAKARGLVGSYETGVFQPGTAENYRVPDLVFTRPEHRSERGVEGRAEVVVEIRSPEDETYDKLAFYAAMEVQEVVIVQPETRAVELYRLEDKDLVPVEPGPRGELGSSGLGVTFTRVDGPRLLVSSEGGSVEL